MITQASARAPVATVARIVATAVASDGMRVASPGGLVALLLFNGAVAA